jgi:hypothetical protein
MEYRLHGVQMSLSPTCGAMNRRGLPCGCKALFANGRCRFHGGLSTGPKTPEGKRRSLEAMRAGYRAWVERRRAAQRSGELAE